MRAMPVPFFALLLAGCEQAMQDMYDQPRYEPYEPSALFEDGTSARQPPAGTVAARAGALAATSSAREGTVPPLQREVTVSPLGPDGQPLAPNAAASAPPPVSERPAVTPGLLARGRERYQIYCLPCHGALGNGQGVVPSRGFPAPPSYHLPRLRNAPDAHFYAVMTAGYGVMYSYASRVAPADRWAIVAYIRALQLSQGAPVQQLPDDDRRALEHADGG